jgi:hypothetical protein
LDVSRNAILTCLGYTVYQLHLMSIIAFRQLARKFVW